MRLFLFDYEFKSNSQSFMTNCAKCLLSFGGTRETFCRGTELGDHAGQLAAVRIKIFPRFQVLILRVFVPFHVPIMLVQLFFALWRGD